MAVSLLLLMTSAAGAEVPFLVFSNGWSLEETPVEVLLTADVDTHMPFNADRLAMLTPITDMLSLHLVQGKDEGRVAVGIAGEEKLALQYSGNAVQLSCLPGTAYTAASDPMSILLGEDVSVENGYEALGLAPEGETLLTDGRELLAGVPEGFKEYGKRSKNTTSITGYGKSAYIMDYAFASNDAETFKGLMLACCPSGWLREIIESLTFSGKQTVRMYYTAEDVLLRVEYNGSCGPTDDLRTVKLVYKLRHDDEADKDYVELTSPAKKGTNKNSLTFERTVETNKSGVRTVVGTYKYSISVSGVASVWSGEFNLKNALTDSSDVISGEVTFQTKLDGADKYDAITIAPKLEISGNQENPVITGTVEVTEKYAGRETEHALVTVDLKRAEALQWTEPTNTVDLSALDEAGLAAVQQEVAAAVATTLVRPLIVALGKDAQWFFRDLSDEAIQAILDAAASAQ